MFITQEPLELTKFYLDPKYNGGKHHARHEVKPSYEIKIIDKVKRKLTLNLNITFVNEATKELICDAYFIKKMNVEITNEPNNDLEQSVFLNDITEVFEDVNTLLLDKIPSETIYTTPLMLYYEKQELTDLIYVELKKHVA